MRITLLISWLFLMLSSQIISAQTHLSIGESVVVTVSADDLFQPTLVSVVKGDSYRIDAQGEWQDAGFPSSDAEGFKGFTAPMFFGMLLKPMPGQYYMKLCGKVGTWKFPVGNSTEVKMKRNGKLLLFPNDAKGFFDNNSGSMSVTITRIK